MVHEHGGMRILSIRHVEMAFIESYSPELHPKLQRNIFSRVHATLQPALSVRRSGGRSIGSSNFIFFGFLRSMASLLLPK